MNREEKKDLSRAWAKEAVDYMIGPQMAVLAMKSMNDQIKLEKILVDAVVDLFQKNDYGNTNDWVKAACERIWDLYNTFMTAKLIDMFDNGIPTKSPIVLARGTRLNN